jgi:hypothetical protein
MNTEHILSEKVDGEGNMRSRTPVCTCGWQGIPAYAYNDDQSWDVRSQGERHLKAEQARASQESELIALQQSLAISNNGYLFAPSSHDVRVAQENPLYFVSANGLVFGRGHVPAQYRGEPKPQTQLIVDGPDYEALILMRQECDGFYD